MYVCRKLLREVCLAGAIKTEFNISTKDVKKQRAEDCIEYFWARRYMDRRYIEKYQKSP